MQFIRFNNEDDLEKLARRAYDVAGRGAAEKLRNAVVALRAANPHLSDMDKLKRGAPILVPAVPGVSVSDRVLPFAEDATEVARLVAAELKPLSEAVESAFAREVTEANGAARLARSKKVGQLVRKMRPKAESLLSGIETASMQRSKEAKLAQKRLGGVLDAAASDLETLARRLS